MLITRRVQYRPHASRVVGITGGGMMALHTFLATTHFEAILMKLFGEEVGCLLAFLHGTAEARHAIFYSPCCHARGLAL